MVNHPVRPDGERPGTRFDVDSTGERQLTRINGAEVRFELAFSPTAPAEDPFNDAHLVQEPADQLYPGHFSAGPDRSAAHPKPDLSYCVTLLNPVDDHGGPAFIGATAGDLTAGPDAADSPGHELPVVADNNTPWAITTSSARGHPPVI